MRTRGVIAAAAATVVVGVGASGVQGQVFGVNLVTNGGAESGPASPNGQTIVAAPGWSAFGGFTVVGYGTAGFPGPAAGRGSKFFCGGPDSIVSTGSQDVDVSAGAADIDGGGVTFTLSALLGGNGSQDDHADVTVIFLDGSGQSIATDGVTGPFAVERNNQTGLWPRTRTASVPPLTRRITVAIFMARANGVYNDAYADNLSLVLTQPPCEPDFTLDGNVDQGDVEYLVDVVGGGDNPNQRDPDFNRDGNADQGDVETLIDVVAGGACPS